MTHLRVFVGACLLLAVMGLVVSVPSVLAETRPGNLKDGQGHYR